MKMTYTTIEADTLKSFDVQSNSLAADSWTPVFGMVIHGSGSERTYVQQWQRYK